MKRLLILGLSSLVTVMAHGASEDPKDLVEYRCGVLPKGNDPPGGATLEIAVAAVAANDPISLPAGVTPETHTISCARSLLVPTLNDAKLLAAGYRLFIGSGAKDGTLRMAIYFDKPPSLTLVVATGKQTRRERQITERVLKQINAMLSNPSLERP